MTLNWENFLAVLGKAEESTEFLDLLNLIGERPLVSHTPDEYNDPLGKTKYYKFKKTGLEIGFRQERMNHIHFFLKAQEGYQAYSALLCNGITSSGSEIEVTKIFGPPNQIGGGKNNQLIGYRNRWIKYEMSEYSIRFELSQDSSLNKATLIKN